MNTKNITNLLARGNLTPKEKFLLLIHNDIQKAKTGKDILTDADKKAIENWKAETNEEAKEWNRLNDGWKLSGRMNIEVEFAFQNARINHLSQMPMIMDLLFYPANRRANFCINTLKQIKKVTIEEAMEITRKQREVKLREGMDFDYAVYNLAFELLDPKDQKGLKGLYEDVAFDHQYLDQEEIIANLYGGKSELSDEAKDKLAELVAEQSYNKFAKEYQLFHYFACIPLLEVARYFLKTHGIEIPGKQWPKDQQAEDGYDDTLEATTKAMKQYAGEHNTTIKAMLRKSCRQWLDKGLLDDYTPLIASNGAQLLKRWFASKINARKTLLKHAASGELEFRNRTEAEGKKEKLWSKNLYNSEFAAAQAILENLHLEPTVKGELDEKRAFETFNDRVITGESLYAFKSDYEFVNDFKKRADTYDPNLGLVYSDNDPEHKGEHLDQELLICDQTNEGEPAAFSQYGMSVTMISGILRAQNLFEEYRKSGKLYIRFKKTDFTKVFSERRQAFIDDYAVLLGYEKILEKLSPIYETNMAEHVSERLASMREDVEQNNRAIRIATNTDDEARKSYKLLSEESLQFEEDFTIDINAIEPNQKIIQENEMKIRQIFPVI